MNKNVVFSKGRDLMKYLTTIIGHV